MKTNLGKVLGLILLVLSWCNGALAEESNGKLNQELQTIVEAEWTAYANQNLDTLATLIDPDAKLVIRLGNRVVDDRAEFLASLKQLFTKLQVLAWHVGNFRVKTYGRVAVVAYKWTEAGINDGEPYKLAGEAKEVFVKRDNRWVKQFASIQTKP